MKSEEHNPTPTQSTKNIEQIQKKAENFSAMIEDLINLIREEKILNNVASDKTDAAMKLLREARQHFLEIKVNAKKYENNSNHKF